MMTQALRAAWLGAIAAVAIQPAALAGPAIATDWFESTLTQETCFARAEQAFGKMGLGNLERTRFSRFAQTGDYTMQVRCIAEKNMVLIITAGPSRQQVQAHQAKLVDLF
jgi:hypothetical protein